MSLYPSTRDAGYSRLRLEEARHIAEKCIATYFLDGEIEEECPRILHLPLYNGDMQMLSVNGLTGAVWHGPPYSYDFQILRTPTNFFNINEAFSTSLLTALQALLSPEAFAMPLNSVSPLRLINSP